MKGVLIVATLVALTLAKPDTYREKEDFQYSRSSTDEGTKSGYYGAQRGNMGGNYEKAHNMDTLAQSQMSGLVSQVHGELGEGVKTPVGDVFGSGSTRGVYGQGYRDLSNLSGRNFQEGEHHGGSGQLSSYSSASGSQRAGARSSFGSYRDSDHSSSYGTQRAGTKSASMGLRRYDDRSSYGSQRASHSAADEISESSSQSYGSSSGHNSRYSSQSGYMGRKGYERSDRIYQNLEDDYGSENQRRYNHAPIKVILVPGTKVDVPFTAQTAEEKANLEDFEENILNSGTKTSHRNRGTNTGKRYESSFNYHKEWEKHNSSPQAVSLSRPITSDSSHESDYYDHQQSRGKSSSSRYNNQNSRYASGANLEDYNSQTRDEYASSQRHGYQSYGAKSAHEKSNAYKDDTESINNLKTSNKDRSPKRYESSFAYHKSWERQGDPYVIHPGTDGSQDNVGSQRLTDASAKGHQYSQYGSQQYRHSQQRYSSADC